MPAREQEGTRSVCKMLNPHFIIKDQHTMPETEHKIKNNNISMFYRDKEINSKGSVKRV